MAAEQITSTPSKKPLSQARIESNKRNARLSTGPKPGGKSRFNAVKHGLSSKLAWIDKVSDADREYARTASHRLAPRNAVESLKVHHLLEARLQERLSLETERLVLTRPPLLLGGNDDRPFLFLQDPTSLSTFQQLARHVSHLGNVAEKEFLGLLRVRADNWTGAKTRATQNDSSDGANSGTGDIADALLPHRSENTTAHQLEPGTLADCLDTKRILLPDEDADQYRRFARELWEDFMPRNVLEGFLVCDIVQMHWRAERIVNLKYLVLARNSCSLTGQDGGLSFGFVADTQRLCAFGELEYYEKVLRHRLEKRMALLRRVRKERWVDAGLPADNSTAKGGRGEPPVLDRAAESKASAPLPVPQQTCGMNQKTEVAAMQPTSSLPRETAAASLPSVTTTIAALEDCVTMPQPLIADRASFS